MTVTFPYIEIISSEFPTVQVTSTGDGSVYENLVHVGGDPIPPQSELQQAYPTIKKRIKNVEINNNRRHRMTLGFWWRENLFECDQVAQRNANGVVTSLLIGNTLPPNFVWRTKANTGFIMDEEDVNDFAIAMSNYITILFQWSWQIKEAMEAIEDIEVLLAFDASLGWPSNNWDGTGPGPTTLQSMMTMVSNSNYQMDFNNPGLEIQ